MKTTTKLLSILLLIILTQSCTKDPSCGDLSDINIYYNIADSNKAKIPYTGNDTLVFISDANDTATLIGQGKKTYYKQVVKGNGYNDCPRNTYYNYENIAIDFIGNDTTINLIQFIINSKDLFSEENFIRISINDNQYSDFSTLQFIESNKIPDDSIFVKISEYEYGYNMGNKIILFNLKYGILKIKDFTKDKIWILKLKN